MKKNARNLIIMLVVLVAVGAVAAVLLLNPGKMDDYDDGGSSVVSDTSQLEKLLEIDESEVESITYTVGGESYTILRDSTGEESSYTIEGLEELNLDTSKIKSLATSSLTISALKSVGAQGDLEKFGLVPGEDADHGVKVDIKTKSGNTSYIIGSVSPESNGRYIMLEGSDEISIASVSAYAFNKKENFISLTVYEVPGLTGTDAEGNAVELTNELTSITIKNPELEEEIVVEFNANANVTYTMVSPMKSDASLDKFNNLPEVLKTINAKNVAVAFFTQEDLETYGLAEPSAYIEYTMNGVKHKLTLGNTDEAGDYYMIADDLKSIYTITKASVTDWATGSINNFLSSYIYIPNIKNVKTLTLEEGSTATKFVTERVLNEEKTTESAPFYDLTIALEDGTSIEYDNYQPLYAEIISMAILSREKTEYDNKNPIFSIEYTYHESAGSDKIEFFELEGKDRYVVEMNGEYSGVMRKVTLDSVIPDIAVTASNQSIKE